MANAYLATALLEARKMISDPNNKKFELRPVRSNVSRVFLDNAEQAFIDLAAIRESTTRTTSAKYFSSSDTTITSSKSCSPSGEEGATGDVDLTWAQKGFAVKLADKVFAGNEVSKQQALAMKLYKAEMDFWQGTSGMDATLLAYLNTNRTQVNAISDGSGRSTWDSSNYIAKVAQADKERFYNYAVAEMGLNNYSPMYDEIANTMWSADVQDIFNQGPANDVNTSYQRALGFDSSYSNLLAPATYYDTTHFIIPKGGVALVTWNEVINREGKDLGTKYWTTYESMVFPGIYFDLFVTEDCGDSTSIGGGTQDLVANLEFTLNYSIAKQPLSVENETPIFKYGILSA